VTPRPRIDLRGVRLHVVTGKGGSGKTTVAAALALALAGEGRRVLLAEVEGRQGIAQLFDVAPLPYEERKVAAARNGGDVIALAVDAEAALLEYLDMYYHLGRAGKAMRKIGLVEFATTVAPGVRDVLLTGKLYEAVRRRDRGDPVYDAVVLDAPPTGRITRFLNVNREVSGVAKVGPIKRQSDSIMELLYSPRTAVHLVTLLEEMPTQETIDAVAELRAAQLPVGALIVNMVRQPHLKARDLADARKGALDTARITADLQAGGLADLPNLTTLLVDEAADHAERVALEKQERRRLKRLDLPLVDVPWRSDGIDLSSLYHLADVLDEQGLR